MVKNSENTGIDGKCDVVTKTCDVAVGDSDFTITRISSLSDINLDTLMQKMQDTFSHKGNRVIDDYFGMVQDTIKTVYVFQDYDAGIIIRDVMGVPYACKIYVHPDFQRMGIANAMIKMAVYEQGSLVARASINNDCNVAYYKKIIGQWNQVASSIVGKTTTCDMLGDYLVFCINLDIDKWVDIKADIAYLPKTVVKS